MPELRNYRKIHRELFLCVLRKSAGSTHKGDGQSKGKIMTMEELQDRIKILEQAVRYEADIAEQAISDMKKAEAIKADLLEALELLLDQDKHGEDEVWVRVKAKKAIQNARGQG